MSEQMTDTCWFHEAACRRGMCKGCKCSAVTSPSCLCSRVVINLLFRRVVLCTAQRVIVDALMGMAKRSGKRNRACHAVGLQRCKVLIFVFFCTLHPADGAMIDVF